MSKNNTSCKNCIYLFPMTMPDEKIIYWCEEKEKNINVDTDICNEYICMTNADVIRDMSDEQLAELMDNSLDYFNCEMCEFRIPNNSDGTGCNGQNCKQYILKWLKSKVTDDDE